MERVWITFIVILLVVTTLVWGGYSFYTSSTEVDENPEAVMRSNKIKDFFDIETLLVVEESVNEQDVETSKYHELDANGDVYEDTVLDDSQSVIEP
jgi:hypothetical protein